MAAVIAPLMKHHFRTAFAAAILVSCGGRSGEMTVGPIQQSEPILEPIIGLPCEGCEAVFEGQPATLGWQARIASESEPGDALRITGVVRDLAGRATPNIIVYAYHTNAQGIYPTDERLQGLAAYRHGRLRGWVRTDADGRYQFDTIRPAGYPGTDLPAHVHMHIIEPGRCTYYIDDVMFDDDPRLTESAVQKLTQGRGGNGIAKPVQDADGTWLVTRDIVLGAAVPSYPARR